MTPVLILYASREGHTRRIAEYLQDAFRLYGAAVDLVEANHLPPGLRLAHYGSVFLAASVHRGEHEREVIDFVKHHLQELENKPSVFLSVSLSEAGAEDATASARQKAKAAHDVQHMIDAFVEETGWHPSKIEPVAGALLYTKYNFILRFFMKRIARDSGASTDTSQDHDFTDWEALDRLVAEWVRVSVPATTPLDS